MLGSAQTIVAAKSFVDIDEVLGATQPSVFECLLSGESLELAVVPPHLHVASAVPLTTLVGATADSVTQVGAS